MTGIPLTAVVGAVGDAGANEDKRAELNALFGRLSGRDQGLLIAIARSMLERT